MLYSYGYRYSLLTGRNINTPINGVRPDPDFANVVLATSDAQRTAAHDERVGEPQSRAAAAGRRTGGAGRRRSGMIMVGGGGPMMIMDGPGGGPAATTGQRFQWNRGLTLSGFYTYGQNYDNTDGAFVIPASIFLADAVGAGGIRSPPQHAHRAHQHGAPQPHRARRHLGRRPRRR